jgi:phosphatidylethanolamine/phosphatidyl-N-methylethanolamine N-methyltransferase
LATQLGDYFRFFVRFFLRPNQQGAVAPSSRYLAYELTREMGIESARSIAELGPGTGVVTKEIIRLKGEQSSLLVVEKDEHWIRLLSKRYPSVDLVQGCATKLDELARERELEPFDAVVCGLPFTVFSEDLQRSILTAIVESLAVDGVFSTFTYVHAKDLPTAKRFRSLLEGYFDHVETSNVVWRNTPPALVYRAWSAKALD